MADHPSHHPPHHHAPPQPDRRDFLTKAGAIVIGGGLALVAPVAGLFVFLDPLRRKSGAGTAVKVATLDALPANGDPVQKSVLATRVDAWNRTPNVPIGAVFLEHRKDGGVRALNAACPHAGCFVEFRPSEGGFHCPCHNSSFALDGSIKDPTSPSPRGMDELPVEIRNGGEVWVTYQNFLPGKKEKIAVI
jgi:Rieske Fe-S protein